MSSSSILLGHIEAAEHVVQLYGEDDRLLVTNVSQFLADALRRGEGALVIATPRHRAEIYQKLWMDGFSPVQAEQDRQLLLLDAGRTLAQFMVMGQPNWDRFEAVVGGILNSLRPREKGSGGRAFGEMVALLWKAERFSEAICLEHYWNRLLKFSNYSLFCGYPVDVFAPDFNSEAMSAVLGAHSHLLPANDHLEAVLHRAMDEVLGARGAAIREGLAAQEAGAMPALPPGERLVRWLRSHLTEYAGEILKRARRYYHEARESVSDN